MKQALKLGLLLFIVFAFISCGEEAFTGKPKNTITVKKAKELSNNFDQRYKAMSEVIGKDDNRSGWYSLGELEQYIAYIKKEGAAKKLDVDGIRIYFGAYGPNESGRENYATLFLVPTVKSNIDANVKGFAPVANQSNDTDQIEPLNWSDLGNPPKKKY